MSKAAELAALIANVNNGSSLGNKNLIINGAMNVAQRGTVTGADDGDYGGPDRFAMRESSALVVTMSQDSSVPTGQGFNNSMKLDVTTADSSVASGDYAYLGYRFEGQDLQSIKKGTSEAVPITLSFWIKTTITGTYVIQLYDNDTSGGRHISKSYTVSSADTWEKKTITFAGDTTGALDDDNAYSLQIYWWLLAGTDFTSGTLATSWASFTLANAAVGQVNAVNSTSNNIYITGVQMEIGEKATEFEHEPFETTLRKASRYYTKIARTDNQTCHIVCYAQTAQVARASFHVPMRTTPSITETNFNLLYGSGGEEAITSVDDINHDEQLVSFRLVCSANLTAGDALVLHSDGVATLTFDAEL